MAVFVGSAESRVVFHGFGEYVRVPAPWSYVLVTVALYGGLGACVAAASGALGERGGVPTRAAAAACAIAGVAGVVAVGAPPWDVSVRGRERVARRELRDVARREKRVRVRGWRGRLRALVLAA